MARPTNSKFGRDQILERVFDEDAKALFSYEMELAIAHGQIPNMFWDSNFGENSNVDQNQDNDIWELGGTYDFLSAATILTLSSATSTDEATDTGARTVEIITLDGGFSRVTTNYTMNGTSVVTLTGTHIRGNSGIVKSAGSNNGAQATIFIGYGTVTAGEPANKVMTILPANNETLLGISTVPSGHTGYIKQWGMLIGGLSGTARFARAHLQSRTNGGIRRVRRIKGLSTDLESVPQEINYAVKVEEKNDVILMVNNTSTDNLKVGGYFDMIMVEN